MAFKKNNCIYDSYCLFENNAKWYYGKKKPRKLRKIRTTKTCLSKTSLEKILKS